MIIVLLLSTFVIAILIATIVVYVFKKPIDDILKRVVPPEISYAWARYLRFALYVVGIGGGVRVWDFEKYLVVQEPYKEVVRLTGQRLVLELYNTIIGTLQAMAMVLLVFFVFALLAVVVVRIFETRQEK